MWLLNAFSRQLEYLVDEREAKFAILSHTWDNGEVTFQDVWNGSATSKQGYSKIDHACREATCNGLDYIWIDTCCINKQSSAELTEAINSMYRYYATAALCFAFLSDAHDAIDAYENMVLTGRDSKPVDPRNMSDDELVLYSDEVYGELQLENCRWFTRGWTLQELIAPKDIRFFGPGWYPLGTKQSLLGTLSAITRIDMAVLKDSEMMAEFTIASRMSWAAGRKTVRVEDRAYSLLGIFGISMSMRYGEGPNAFVRLQEEIIKRSTDHSIFAWGFNLPHRGDLLLAASPDDFQGCHDVVHWPAAPERSFQMTNNGLEIHLPIVRPAGEFPIGFAVLNCHIKGNSIGPLVLCLGMVQGAIDNQSHNVVSSMYCLGSHPSYNSQVPILPLEEISNLVAEPMTILKRPRKAPRDLIQRQLSYCKVWLSVENTMTNDYQLHLTPLKSLSRETWNEFQVFRPLEDNRVVASGSEGGMPSHSIVPMHEGHAAWKLTRGPGSDEQEIGVAVRLSGLSEYEPELRLAIYDPRCCKQCASTIGTYGHEVMVNSILEGTTPSMRTSSTCPDWADVEIHAEYTRRMTNTIIKVCVSLRPSGSIRGAPEMMKVVKTSKALTPSEYNSGTHDVRLRAVTAQHYEQLLRTQDFLRFGSSRNSMCPIQHDLDWKRFSSQLLCFETKPWAAQSDPMIVDDSPLSMSSRGQQIVSA